MLQEKFLLEYLVIELPTPKKSTVRLYENGNVAIEEEEFIFSTGRNINIKRSKSISPEQIITYAKKLVQAKFFDLEDNYYDNAILAGFYESLTLNYQGRSKKIECRNKRPSSPVFYELISDLKILIKLF